MIYYVEDDESIRELVVYTLHQMGMEVCGFSDPIAFHAAMQKAAPDLILLDIMLPGEDGLSILKGLRSHPATEQIPVILITAKDTEYDVVKGLDHGADDYIAKPFGMAELAARVRARLRRVKPTEEDCLIHGELVMDRKAHTVSAKGEVVPLTLKEYELLRILMENKGTAFTREHLLERIWDYAYDGGTRTVDVHVQTLRSKLGACGDLIETVRGVGYRLGVDGNETKNFPQCTIDGNPGVTADGYAADRLPVRSLCGAVCPGTAQGSGKPSLQPSVRGG